MVAIVIVSDKGQVFTMSRSLKEAVKCLKSVKKPTKPIYVNDDERRVEYLARAWELIE